ncbi:MAG: stage II sporulation protein P [Syntrophomonadaceae bacterium]|nr:stage II sporulation protein P [Syntrophomonadaceae bacterium]
MDTTAKRYILIFFGILLVILMGAYLLKLINAPQAKPLGDNQQEPSYYTVWDENGHVILETGIPLYVDDIWISEQNQHYQITKVENDQAWAELKTTDNSPLKSILEAESTAAQPAWGPSIPVQTPPQDIHVVIYHTHSDESYVPTSGTASKPGHGDIYSVGAKLAQTFQLNGISVTHSMNNHNPHDINAYHRSRRTARQLLNESPDAAFDIHRDAAPASAYQTTINGIPAARVTIVMGRSNPNFKANLDFALQVKAAADSLYPGLLRGIFIGRGNYNQDLYPTALLLEIGTHGNYLLSAERAATAMGDALIAVLRNR